MKWKSLDNYPGYSVSDTGLIRSDSRQIWNGKGWYISKARLLKPNRLRKGYLQVDLKTNKCRHLRQVHRLIAEAFIPNPDNLPQVNHINGIKWDNRVENLEWCNNSMNQIHAYTFGLQKPHNTWGGKRKTQPVALLDDNGGISKVFSSVPEAARSFGEKTGANLWHHLKGKRLKSFHGHQFKLI